LNLSYLTWVNVNAIPLFGDNNELSKIVINFIDITSYKNAQQALKESEEKFRTIFKESKSINLIINPETKYIVDANQAACKFYGYTHQGLTSMQIGDINLLSEIKIVAKMQAAKENQFNHFEFKHKLSNGIIKEVEVYSNPVIINNEKLLFSIIHDITDRKKAVQALTESEERYSSLVSHIPGATYRCLIDEHWTMLFISDNMNKIIGFPASDFIKSHVRTYASICHPEDIKKTNKIVMNAVNKKESYSIEYRIKRADGEYCWILEKGRGVFNDKGEYIYLDGIILDNNKRKQMEKELKDSEIQLRELNTTKDKFFSIIAHDLKSPFNGLLGFSSILLENHKEYDDNKREGMIKLVNDSATSTFKLLENLLTWSRTQLNIVTFVPKELQFKIVLFETISNLKASANQKGIKLIETISDDEVISTDKDLIDSVLRNLISNAIKFTKRNGTVIIEAVKQDKNNSIKISVTDTGVGIPKDKIDDLFRLDKNTSTQGTDNETGTGLGLIICKEFVEKLGGKIWVESEVGKGSTFSFTIPNK